MSVREPLRHPCNLGRADRLVSTRRLQACSAEHCRRTVPCCRSEGGAVEICVEVGNPETARVVLAGMHTDELVALGDSVLAHSLRRRTRELEHPESIVVSHDASVI